MEEGFEMQRFLRGDPMVRLLGVCAVTACAVLVACGGSREAASEPSVEESVMVWSRSACPIERA